jgi:hypothetical protein
MISVYPKYISVKYWAATVCDDYSDFPLPVLHDETKWAVWAQNLISTPPFMIAGVPSPYKGGHKRSGELAFKSWEEWAKKAYLIMLSQDNNNL